MDDDAGGQARLWLEARCAPRPVRRRRSHRAQRGVGRRASSRAGPLQIRRPGQEQDTFLPVLCASIVLHVVVGPQTVDPSRSFPQKVTKPSLLATLSHDEHALARRSVSPAFSMHLLVELEEFVDACFDDLCVQLDEKISSAGGKATVDMGDLLQFVAMDVVGELAFGRSFGLTKAGYDTADFLPMLDAYTASSCLSGASLSLLTPQRSRHGSSLTLALAGTQPWARRVLHWWLTRRLGSSGNAALGQKASQAVTLRLDELRQAEETGDTEGIRRDILSKLIAAKNPDGSPFSIEQVKVQANSILGPFSLAFFGRTTACADSVHVVRRRRLGHNEHHVPRSRRLRRRRPGRLQEGHGRDRAVARGGRHPVPALACGGLEALVLPGASPFLTFPTGALLLLAADARPCSSCAQACLKETLRLHPAVPWVLPRVVPEGGAVVAGRFFSQGEPQLPRCSGLRAARTLSR